MKKYKFLSAFQELQNVLVCACTDHFLYFQDFMFLVQNPFQEMRHFPSDKKLGPRSINYKFERGIQFCDMMLCMANSIQSYQSVIDTRSSC